MRSVGLKANTLNIDFIENFEIGCEFKSKDTSILEQNFIDFDEFNLYVVFEINACRGQSFLPIAIE